MKYTLQMRPGDYHYLQIVWNDHRGAPDTMTQTHVKLKIEDGALVILHNRRESSTTDVELARVYQTGVVFKDQSDSPALKFVDEVTTALFKASKSLEMSPKMNAMAREALGRVARSQRPVHQTGGDDEESDVEIGGMSCSEE